MNRQTKKHTPNFSVRTLAQAVTVGLVMLGGGEAMANTSGGLTNVNGSVRNTADGTTYQTIGDLEIYQAAQAGAAGIVMMLDMSGSMFACDGGRVSRTQYDVYQLRDKDGKVVTEEVEINGRKVAVEKEVRTRQEYCNHGGRNRLSELKHAMLTLLSDGRNLEEKYKIGFGTFPAQGNLWGGRMVAPVKNLTPEHRYRMMKEIAGLTAFGATPSSHAFPEAAAYMLGTNTANVTGSTIKTGYITKKIMEWKNNRWEVADCAGYNAAMEDAGLRLTGWQSCGIQRDGITGAVTWGNDAANADFNKLNFDDIGNFNALRNVGKNETIEFENNKNPANLTFGANKYYVSLGEKIEYRDDSGGNTGFAVSATDTKNEARDKYQSPIDVSQCDGYGIYFLTDGEPNNASSQRIQMARSLGYTETNNAAIDRRLQEDSGNKLDLPSETIAGTLYNNTGWAQMGAYAAILRDSSKNGGKPPIRTATVGFGGVFTSQSPTYKDYVTTDAEGNRIVKQVVDCSKYSRVDAQNLCKLGELGAGYGEGGFLATNDAAAIQKSVVDFIASLNQSLSSQPAGTISVPKDPLSVSNIQPYAYLPMIEPKVTSNQAVWRGNLKKFHTLNGTLYGANKTSRLYIPATNATTENKTYPSQFNTSASDIWQKTNTQGNNALIDVGGAKEHIKDIKTDTKNSRFVYLENYVSFDRSRYENADTAGKIAYLKTVKPDRQLVKVGIQDGKLVGFDKLKSPYNLDDKVHIINFLGVNLTNHKPAGEKVEDLQEAVDKAIAAKSFYDRVLGGVVHSVPVLATYKGEFEETGSISSNEDKRDDTLLYGSMDGALHMVDASEGNERFAFIPRAIFEDTEQRNALIVNSTNNGRVGNPVFGVDAPWTVYGDYVYEFSDKDGKAKNPAVVRAKHMYAFGGMRMGGNGIYGLDISGMRNAITSSGEKEVNGEIHTSDGTTVKREPKLMFSINRYTPGFERMGQTWSKPLVAKIKTGPKPLDTRDVVVFGGGYDMCYEHPKFKVGSGTSTHALTTKPEHEQTAQFGQFLGGENDCNKTAARGNAVYMVDMKSGKLIASWTGDKYPDDMKDSVVGEITALDRNNNGAIDHLYFADLGGKVFRVDLKEGINPVGAVASGSTDEPIVNNVSDTITRRLVKVLDANADKKGDPEHINYRFYDQPLVSFYDHAGKTFAVVNIASGDRSSPVHTHRNKMDGEKNITNANRIFGFFDRDLASTRLDRAAADPGLITKNLTINDLQLIDPREVDRDSAAVAKPDATGKVTGTTNKVAKKYLDTLKATVESKTKTNTEGWWYQMDRFDGLTKIPNLKSIGTGFVTGNVYYANIYSPNYEYTTGNSCTARVSGGTERQLYCLPWGVCATATGAITTENGVLGFIKAGPGIQELALGTVTSEAGTSTPFRAILGHQTLAEIAAEDNQKRRDVNGGDRNRAFSRLPTDAAPAGGSGTGADVYGQNIVTAPQYTLAVQRWYDLQNESRQTN